MTNAVIIGILRAVEPGAIVLSSGIRIVVPPTLSVPDFPIGCTLTVVVDRQSGDTMIAESIQQTDEGGLTS